MKIFNWNPGQAKYPTQEWFDREDCNSTNKIRDLKKLNTTFIFVTCSGEVE